MVSKRYEINRSGTGAWFGRPVALCVGDYAHVANQPRRIHVDTEHEPAWAATSRRTELEKCGREFVDRPNRNFQVIRAAFTSAANIRSMPMTSPVPSK